MANVKTFADQQTDKRTNRQTDKRPGQKLYTSDLSMWGHNYSLNDIILYFFFNQFHI